MKNGLMSVVICGLLMTSPSWAQQPPQNANTEDVIKTIESFANKIQGTPSVNGHNLTEILRQVDPKNITPQSGLKIIDDLLNLLPNDSAIKPLLVELIRIMTGYKENFEKAVNAE